MLTVGQEIERYTVEDYLGHGGMAVVYKVRHNSLGSLHALKILTVPRPKVRERLMKEGRVQAVLRHPNIVAVTDVLEVNGSPALLMEYVDGPTLESWLIKHKPTVEESHALIQMVCEGVGDAHHHGLVHRDLKPANILLARTAGGFVPKVTDFGIAKIFRGDQSTGVAGGVPMGTPFYMSPEQIRDARDIDPRADIWSIGCILYEMVTGERPFHGDDVLSVMNAVVSGRYRSARELVPELSNGILSAIDGCLQVDPAHRFTTCFDVVESMGPVPRSGFRVKRGLDLSDADFEDSDVRRSRIDWLSTGEPAIIRDLTPHGSHKRAQLAEDTGPPILEDTDEQDITQPPTRPPGVVVASDGRRVRFDDDEETIPPMRMPVLTDTPSVPVSGTAATQPKTGRRVAGPAPEDSSAHGEEPTVFLEYRVAQSQERQLFLTVVIGVLVGLLTFSVLLLVLLT